MNPIEAFADAIMEHEGWYGPSSMHPLGSRSWRNRNPGNLRFSHDMTGVDGQGYAIFDSFLTGYKALLDDLRAKFAGPPHTSTGLGPQSTILQFFEKYAPRVDDNDTESYARFVADFMARALKKPLSSSSKLSEIS